MEKVNLSNCIAVNDEKLCIYLLSCDGVKYRYYLPSNSGWSFYFSPTKTVKNQIEKFNSGEGDFIPFSRLYSATKEYHFIKNIVGERFEIDGVVVCAGCLKNLLIVQKRIRASLE